MTVFNPAGQFIEQMISLTTFISNRSVEFQLDCLIHTFMAEYKRALQIFQK